MTMMLISHPKMVYRDRGQKNSEVGIRKAETIAKSREQNTEFIVCPFFNYNPSYYTRRSD
jgi:hypothetical protein